MNKWIFILFLLLIPYFIYAVNAETVYDRDQYYNTSGMASIDLSLKELTEVLTDFNGYRNWALKGIDGKDPRSKKFNLILSDVDYLEEAGKFILIFDINLFWPFGSKGNKVYFDIIYHYSPAGTLRTIEFDLSNPTILVPSANLSLELYDHGSESKIYFKSKIKLAWFFDMFFSLKAFKRNFEVRIVNIIRNLRRLFHKAEPEKKKPVIKN
ncbi:MAG: hypothetical protein JXJ04_16850, partial [Spirochaetales bacterium]|nr:hypothetical protein [Spirochaetales bacterium]